MKKKNKKYKLSKIILLLLLITIIGVGIYIGMFISNKLSKVNFQDIDTTDLAINSKLYDEVSDCLSKSEFENILTFVLFGTDSRDSNNMSAGRSDTIIIASIDTNTKKIKLISIPRDTYVEVPGYGKTKINHAYAYGGEALSIKTINQNFGLDITEYATIDFSGLIHIINDIGGVNIDITKAEQEYINQHVAEAYRVTGRSVKKVESYGNVLLTGEQALTHSRNRTIGSDFTRAERQRTVLEAIMNKIASKGISNILSMSDSILEEVRTNIDIMAYAGKLTDVITNSSQYFSNITSIQIPSTDYGKGQYIQGVYYFVADEETMRQDMIDNIYRK